jgi:hypothetical protein
MRLGSVALQTVCNGVYSRAAVAAAAAPAAMATDDSTGIPGAPPGMIAGAFRYGLNLLEAHHITFASGATAAHSIFKWLDRRSPAA